MARGLGDDGSGHHDAAFGIGEIEAIAGWCRAVQAAVPMVQGLRLLCDRLSAEIAAVARVDHALDHGSERARTRIVAFDRRANFSDDIAGFQVSFAQAVCGPYYATAKAGVIWYARAGDFDGNPRLSAPLRQRRLSETVVIPLANHVSASDFLELHFPAGLPVSVIDRIGELGPIFAEAWNTRAVGLFAKSRFAARETVPGKPGRRPDMPVLDDTNPCGLSRSEYRVCLLLSRGLNRKAMLDELSISIATLRTHLRNIYAKTDTSSQAELVQRLLVRPAEAIPGTVSRSHVA